MSTRHHFYISAVVPVLLCACVSQSNRLSSTGEPGVIYADTEAEVVDELRAAATEVDLAAPAGADEVVCRREEKTGSHVRRVVCRTERERAMMRQNSQEWLRSGGLEGGPVVAR